VQPGGVQCPGYFGIHCYTATVSPSPVSQGIAYPSGIAEPTYVLSMQFQIIQMRNNVVAGLSGTIVGKANPAKILPNAEVSPD
jgi:hypothetical protein